jgi:tetratricopeptide (TPR) repeat protein
MIKLMRTLYRKVCFVILTLGATHAFAQTDFAAYEEGLNKFKASDYSAVIESYTAILSNPDHTKRLDEDLYYYRGQSYYHTGEYQKALADLDQSLTLNHYNKATIAWYKGKCYEKLDRKSEALKSFDEAVLLAGTNKKLAAKILSDRAQFHANQGDSQSAQNDLARASSLDPSVKALAQNEVKTPPKPTVSEEKNTQVMIQQSKKEEPKSPPQQPVTETVKSAIAPALADIYKEEKRYALVIGNSNYSKQIGMLKNPVNDATDVATELRNSNFEVQLITNATYVQIREAMRKFHEKLTNGPRDQTVGLFYYAGHGVQYQDENYLVPVDAQVQFEDDITRMCFPVQRMVLANMERSNSRMNIVILDACRNNPFPATSRSVGSGLAEMKRARGSFIAFATAPGSVASDGVGRNGLYTQELLKSLRKKGLTIEQVFKEVRMNVLRLSGDQQYTWDSSNIIGEFYFKF